MKAPAILLIDDDDEFAEILERRLMRRGYLVAIAGSCEAALRVAVDQTFDVVVVDRSLPDGDGVALVKQLKQIRPRLPIVMLSAFQGAEFAQAALNAGGFEYLAKPCSLGDIEASIARALQSKQMSDARA